MTCPKCRQHLRQKYVKELNLNLEYCPKCKGVWFDGGEMEQVMPAADRHLRIPHNAVRLQAPCPKCDERLYVFPYPQTRVTIEMCRACLGFWLDAGEFHQIRKAREHVPPPEELAQDADPAGVKGALIRFIDAALEQLLD